MALCVFALPKTDVRLCVEIVTGVWDIYIDTCLCRVLCCSFCAIRLEGYIFHLT
jgi:hypothetical protein